ncbi:MULTISPECIES: hypothetical protein [Shewanella]|uniref:Uncharacterized protein n=1 Tax=Shewanella scandinavica TaxID=3063538 RepID=A0ABU3G5Q8_9GAMM|nr:hypothetical protein [Shewanella sp. SP2S1-2]MDT3282980.1 hypothetical protein [Shewanella sp. SP2S1-2]
MKKVLPLIFTLLTILSSNLQAQINNESRLETLPASESGQIIRTIDAEKAQVPLPNNNQNQDLLDTIEQYKKVVGDLKSEQQELKNSLTEIENTNSSMNYSMWISILLACVTVIITTLGVVVAVVAFYGYRNVRDSAKEAAHIVASDVAKMEANIQINHVAKTEIARLLDAGELKEHLESAVDLIIRANFTTSVITGSSGFNKYPEVDEEVNE